MKRCLSVLIAVILCVLLGSATGDRFVNSSECKNLDEFLDAIEMGTTVTVTGYIYLGPFDYEMDGVKGYDIGITIDIPGCVARNLFLMVSKEQSEGLEKGDYISVSGQMFSRGNTGNNYYLNTQLENGFVEKLEIPEPAIMDLTEDYDMVSKVAIHKFRDIAKGEGLEVVLTTEKTFSHGTTYYYYLQAGNIFVGFYTETKDLFKGDIIDFEGVIHDYDASSRILGSVS